MAFDLKSFTEKLNSDSALKDNFLSNPTAVLKDHGLQITDEQRRVLEQSLSARRSSLPGREDAMILPIVIST